MSGSPSEARNPREQRVIATVCTPPPLAHQQRVQAMLGRSQFAFTRRRPVLGHLKTKRAQPRRRDLYDQRCLALSTGPKILKARM